MGKLNFIREYIGKNHEFHKSDKNHQVEYMFECKLITSPDKSKANHLDDGQNGIEWVKLDCHEEYRVYPKILVERIKSAYPEIYWGDIN